MFGLVDYVFWYGEVEVFVIMGDVKRVVGCV